MSLPAVQTAIAKRITNSLQEKYDVSITIDRVSASLFTWNTSIKGIYIADHKKDTLIYVQKLKTSLLSAKKAVDGNLQFGEMRVKNAFFNLKTYKNEQQTNLDIFVKKLDKGDDTSPQNSFLLNASEITLEESRFTLIDENQEESQILDFKNIKTTVKDFKIEGSNVSTFVTNLSFLNNRGIAVKQVTSHFTYTPTAMFFPDFNIQTSQSNLNGNLTFTYKKGDLKDFINKVKIDAAFTDVTINSNDLNALYNQFGENKNIDFTTIINGTLNNFTTTNTNVTSEQTTAKGNFTFQQLFSKNKPFTVKAQLANASSNYKQLTQLLPAILRELPTSLQKLQQFSINGNVLLTQNIIDTKLNIKTSLGNGFTDIKLTRIHNTKNTTYKGLISLENFDIGTLINEKTVGNTSLKLHVDGKGFTQKDLNTKITGEIFNITYNNYNYKNSTISGIVKDQLFDGNLVADDKNFKFNFKGLADLSQEQNKLNFTADVSYADLQKLNFVTRDSLSIFSGNINMNMVGNTLDNLAGDINFTKTTYKNQNDNYYFEDFKVASTFIDSTRVITINSPDIITGSIKGKFYINEFHELIENSIGSIYTNYRPNKITQGQYIDFNLKIYNKLIDVFFPEIKFGQNTSIRGNIVADSGEFKLNFKSPQMQFYKNTFDNINLQIDNKNPLFNTYIEVAKIDTQYYDVANFNLINTTIKDTLFFRTEFTGGQENEDMYNLNFYHTLTKDKKSVVGIKTSQVGFKGNQWFLNKENNRKNRVVFNQTLDSISIEEIVMNHNNEQINLQGKLIDSIHKDITLQFKNVSLDKITPTIDSLSLNGIVNGNLNLLQQNNAYLPTSTITINDFKVNNQFLGDLKTTIKGNENLTQYNVDISLLNKNLKGLQVLGDITLADKKPIVNLDASLQELNLQMLSPLGQETLSNIRGYASGNAKITGNLNNPDINGELKLSQAGITIPYLNVDVTLAEQATINLFKQTFQFDQIQITDTQYNTTAELLGEISHQNFKNWYLNLNINTNNNKFLILNTPQADDVLYYGTGFITGNSFIYGFTDQLTIDVNATTASGTSLKIPIDDVATIGDTSFITFITQEEKAARDQKRELKEFKGVELNFDLDVTPDAEVEIVTDKKSGSTLKGRGDGNLLMEINTNGKFNMWGDFITASGDYNFKYGGLIDKKFTVNPGGTITWDGDPLNANINIQAVYSLNANPAILLENPSFNRKIPTDVTIQLEGQLVQPQPTFEIDFPDTNPVVKSELQYRLEGKDRRELQALSLLSQGTFINELNISQQALGNLFETASSIFNQILQDKDGKINLGVSFERGQRNPDLDFQTQDRIGVTVSTQISDRILINGKIGVPVSGVTQTVVAGDVEVQILLNQDGTFSAKIFNKENEIQQFLADRQGYTQGVGLSYQVDFDTFKELFQTIFKKKEE